MNLGDIRDLLDAEVLVGNECMDIEIKNAFAADQLNDILAFAKEGTLLVTGITDPQVVRTAEMLELIGIVFVRGKKPDEEAVNLARIKKVPLLATRYIMFETCGRLFKSGLVGCIEKVVDERTETR
jgi:predicted transcriptional regulator